MPAAANHRFAPTAATSWKKGGNADTSVSPKCLTATITNMLMRISMVILNDDRRQQNSCKRLIVVIVRIHLRSAKQRHCRFAPLGALRLSGSGDLATGGPTGLHLGTWAAAEPVSPKTSDCELAL